MAHIFKYTLLFIDYYAKIQSTNVRSIAIWSVVLVGTKFIVSFVVVMNTTLNVT